MHRGDKYKTSVMSSLLTPTTCFLNDLSWNDNQKPTQSAR